MSDVHDLYSMSLVHAMAQLVGVEPGPGARAKAEPVVMRRVPVMIAVVVVVATVAVTAGAVTVLSTALERVAPASKTLPATKPPTSKSRTNKLQASKWPLSLPQVVDSSGGQGHRLVWRKWQVRMVCFSHPLQSYQHPMLYQWLRPCFLVNCNASILILSPSLYRSRYWNYINRHTYYRR